MIKTLLACVLLTCNNATQTLKQPRELNVNDINSTIVQGNYCLNNAYDRDSLQEYFDEYHEGLNTYIRKEIDFTQDTYTYENLIYYTGAVYSLDKIIITYYGIRGTGQTSNTLKIELEVYDVSYSDITFVINRESSETNVNDVEDNVSLIPAGDLIFRLNNSYMLSKDNYLFFISTFNGVGNSMVRNYNGYYNISLRPQLNFAVFGQLNINNALYTNMMSYNIADQQNSYWFSTTKYDAYYNMYTAYFFEDAPQMQNIYMSGVLMSNTTYSRLSTYGVWGYIQAAPQETGFDDLFFSLADTPIYFLVSMFNWELFGTNLFVALTGLMTLCLILVLVRKFW